MKKNLFRINENERRMILGMHKNATKSNYILSESKKTEDIGKIVLTKNGISEEDASGLIAEFAAGDKSENQKNIPIMAVIYIRTTNPNVELIINIVNEYEDLVLKNRVARIQTKNGKLIIDNEENSGNFTEFANVIHGIQAKYESTDLKKTMKKNKDVVEPVNETLFSNENVDIYEGDTKEKCIKYVQSGLTDEAYSFCIGRFGPGNMYQSYRDNSISSFYFIVDKTRIKENSDGTIDLSDPLHMIVYDAQTNKVELTDAKNTTGTIAKFGTDVKAYQRYLESLGVPIEILKHRPKSEEEKYEDQLLGKPNPSLEWFINLPYKYKSKYIGRGHKLTDEQFDYLFNKTYKLKEA
jgi:hypothetical protein